MLSYKPGSILLARAKRVQHRGLFGTRSCDSRRSLSGKSVSYVYTTYRRLSAFRSNSGRKMSLSCGSKCLKYLLFIFNFFFWAAGAVLLAIGIWFLVDKNTFLLLKISGVTDSLLQAAAIIIIVAGALMFIVGGLGCLAAWQESYSCLIVFATILFILLAAQLATGILAGVYHGKVVSEIDRFLNQSLVNDYGKNSTATDSWNFLQVDLKCCGVSDPSDWKSSWWFYNNVSEKNYAVPVTCCVLGSGDYKNPQPVNETACEDPKGSSSEFRHMQGCKTVLVDWTKTHLAIIIGVAIGLIAIQIIGIIFACCLSHDLRNRGIVM